MKSSLDRFRQLALGQGLTDWCDKTAPKLMAKYDRESERYERLQEQIDREMDDLRDDLHSDSREDALYRVVNLSEKSVNTLSKLVTIQKELTGGGAAALFVHFIKQSNSLERDDAGPAERDATPRRRLSSGAQVIDA